MCTSTGVWDVLVTMLFQQLGKRTGINVKVVHVFACENDPGANAWLRGARLANRLHFRYLLKDLMHFSSGHCLDLLTDRWIPVEQLQVDLLACSLSCRDASGESAYHWQRCALPFSLFPLHLP